MNLKWSRTLAAVGAAVMLTLVLAFYASTDKNEVREWLHIIGFPAAWVGSQLFRGAPPWTRTTNLLFDLFLVSFTAIEGFLIGWCIDFLRKKRATGS